MFYYTIVRISEKLFSNSGKFYRFKSSTNLGLMQSKFYINKSSLKEYVK